MVSEKNILYVLKSAQPGGMEFHVLDLVKGFSKSNRIYVMLPEGPLVDEFKNQGARVFNYFPTSSFDINFINIVKDFCVKNRIHIIHTHELISSQALIGALIARVKKRVHHVHTPFLFWKYKTLLVKFLNSFPNWIYNFIISNFIATDVIALTKSIKSHRLFFELVFPSKIKLIPNSVDVQRFFKKIPPSEIQKFKLKNKIPLNFNIVGLVSRITSEKGHMVLARAFNKLNQNFPNKYFLLLAGGGDLEIELNNYCRKYFPNNYLITGRFLEKDKTLFYKCIDYFVFPSFAEGFGYVPLEALSSGVLVLSSNLPVLRDVLGSSVTYFTSGNANDLYSKICSTIKLNQNDKNEIVKIGQQKALEYTFDAFIKNYGTVYSN